MLWVYRRGLSRDTVGSIATTLLVVPAVSSRCLWLNQTQYGGAKRDCTGCHSIHRVPIRFTRVFKWKEAQRIIIVSGGGRCRKPSGYKGAHMWPGCRYSPGSSCIPVRSHHTDMFPVNQTHSNSASVASPRRLREGPLSRDFRSAQLAQKEKSSFHTALYSDPEDTCSFKYLIELFYFVWFIDGNIISSVSQ